MPPSRIAGQHGLSPRELRRLKGLRNWAEGEMPRKPDLNKGLAALNKLIDAESMAQKPPSTKKSI
jgi:hypothetical protein